MKKVELEDKEYSWMQLQATDFETDPYRVPEKAITVTGTLDCKCWGKGRGSTSLLAYITDDDGSKYLGFAWYSQQDEIRYLGLRDLGIGTRVRAEFVVAPRSGKVKLSKIEAA